MGTLTIVDGREELWQWDLGVSVRLTGVIADELHFGVNKTQAAVAVLDDNVCEIPAIALQMYGCLHVYACLEGQYTKEEFVIKVNKRPKPDGYIEPELEPILVERVGEMLVDNEDFIESVAEKVGGGGVIDDNDVSTSKTWSSNKIDNKFETLENYDSDTEDAISELLEDYIDLSL